MPAYSRTASHPALAEPNENALTPPQMKGLTAVPTEQTVPVSASESKRKTPFSTDIGPPNVRMVALSALSAKCHVPVPCFVTAKS